MSGWGKGPGEFVLTRDTSSFHQGRASAKIEATATTARTSTFGQRMSAAALRGKRIVVSGFLRTDGAMGNGAGMYVRVLLSDGRYAVYNTPPGLINGTRDWTRVELVLEVPGDAKGLNVGCSLLGRGRAYFDDILIEVDTSVQPKRSATPMVYPAAGAESPDFESYPRKVVNGGFEQPE